MEKQWQCCLLFLWPVVKFAYVVDVLYFTHHVSLYPTHIETGGFVTDFAGALFYPMAKHCEPSGKIEPRQNR